MSAPKFEEYLAHESLASISEWRKANGKYVKAILHTGAPDAFVTKAVGQAIEFVPLADPASLKPGDRLTVQILFRGSPAANLHVEASSASAGGSVKHRQLGRTDQAGKIEIRLDVPGFWKLHAIMMDRRKDTAVYQYLECITGGKARYQTPRVPATIPLNSLFEFQS